MMQQTLIEALWQKTEQKNRENMQTIWSDMNRHLIHKISQVKPLCISLSALMEADEAIYMSFHDAAGNPNEHYHDFFEINYVVKGNPVGVIDGHEISFNEGSLYIMNPNAVHYYKAYEDHKDLILNIVLPIHIFEKQIYHPLLSDPILNAFFIRYRLENSNQPTFIHLDRIDDYSQQLIEMLVSEYLKKQQYSLMAIESLLTLLFSFILRSYGTTQKIHAQTVSDLLNHMYQHYQTCTLEDLAQTFNYHPKYLSSKIHRHTGQSFRRLMTMIRLQNAQHYLLYSTDTIDQIASKVGYKEKSSFYSSFKKEFKKSPAEFRRAHLYGSKPKI